MRLGPPIRVQLFGDQTRPLEVELPGRVRVLSLPEFGRLGDRDASRLRVELDADGTLLLDGQRVEGAVRLVSLEPDDLSFAVRVEGLDRPRRFRGVLDLVPHSGGLRLINELTVEEYLAGVVGKEMEDARFSLEALKAQAIAARTFTLYHLSAGGLLALSESFPATTTFQAYGGMDYERPNVVRAVAETAGWALTVDGELFKAYYHGACGGATLNGAAFNERALPPLGGVECASCRERPGAWHEEIPLTEIESALRGWAKGHEMALGGLTALASVAAGDAPVDYLEVRHTLGSFEMRTDQFRAIVNGALSGRLRSARFEVAVETTSDRRLVARFDGQGAGHGVGLCQQGAGALAATSGYREILDHYFPGAARMKVY